MSIEQAETLKSQLTDKWVVVDKNVPELRRFSGLTGRVKTVNMNCQALVEFDGVEDIGWYDIDPDFLQVVDGPAKKEKPTAKAADKPAAKAAAKSSSGGSPLDQIRKQGGPGAGKPAGGGGKASPLDMIRKQGAPGSGGGAKAEEKPAAAPAGDAGKKLSPLDMIRQQGAPGSQEDAAEAPAVKKTAAPASGKKLSPLEMIRQQQAGGAETPAEEAAPDPAAEEAATASESASNEDLSGLSTIEIIRRQGGPKA